MANFKFNCKDIKDKKEFDRIGYHYTCVKEYGNNIYLYKMERIDKTIPQYYPIYELVKGITHKNPDGSIVHKYPNDEQFGIYGYTIMGTEKQCKKNINEKLVLLNNLK